MRILVADDVAENRYLLEALLRGHGYEVASARNGEEALAEVRRAGADLVVADILMPGMDGYQLCRALKTDAALAPIPLVFYTATYTSDEDRAFALGLGASRFIVKPMDPGEFVVVIREVLAEAERGQLEVPRPALLPEPSFDREHDLRVTRKLEKKVEELEAARSLLQASEERYRTLFATSPDPLLVYDVEGGRFLDVNPAASRLYGYTREEFLLLHHVDVSVEPEETVRATRARVELVPVRYHRKKDGTVFPVEITASYRDQDGRGVSTLSIRDIGPRLKAEEEVRRLTVAVEQAQKMEAVGRLAGGIAHDFNNLLTVILGSASFALGGGASFRPGGPGDGASGGGATFRPGGPGDGASGAGATFRPGGPGDGASGAGAAFRPDGASGARALDDSVRADLEEIRKAAERAAALTNQLLIFSRRQALQPQVVDLSEVVEGAGKFLKRLIGEDIEVVSVLSRELPAVLVDPGQMEQVILNLGVNARDAMPRGGRLTIETAEVALDEAYAARHPGVAPGPHVMLAVSDTGTGMDADTQARIFDPFFTTKEVGKGTGLGLSIVHGIVQQSGGSIAVSSEPGKGTVIRVYLPPVAERAAAHLPAPSILAPPGSETVLVVEDEAAVRRLTSALLRERGYTVLEAASGQEALDLLGGTPGPVHLLLSDHVMPGMTGVELAERVRSARPGVRVLFMSGYSNGDLADRAASGSVDCLQKPFTREALAQRVREALDRT